MCLLRSAAPTCQKVSMLESQHAIRCKPDQSSHVGVTQTISRIRIRISVHQLSITQAQLSEQYHTALLSESW